MIKQIQKEDLRTAQEGIWNKAFNANNRFKVSMEALVGLLTSETLLMPVGILVRLNKKLK